MESAPRRPTDYERRIIRRLIAALVPDSIELQAQLEALVVRPIDEDGSLKFEGSPIPLKARWRVPVEGDALDSDGVTIHFLLHVVGGFATELEVYKDDGSRVLSQPNPETMTVY